MGDYSWPTILFAFSLTLFAGLSTGVGSALAFFTKKTDERFLSAALGFSAGIMIYVSFVEILVKARESLDSFFGATRGNIYTTLGFFGGIALIALIDAFVPKATNPHEVKSIEDMDLTEQKNQELMRMGLFSALAIAIHNFPEGLATFIAALEDPAMGVSIAIAIAIHNIPEGIAVSVPIYYATKSRKQAFKYSFLSGLSEPVGAIVGFLILMPFLNEAVLGFTFAMVAGIMVYISLDELLPSAQKYGEHHIAIGGLVAGMAVMATSLVLLG